MARQSESSPLQEPHGDWIRVPLEPDKVFFKAVAVNDILRSGTSTLWGLELQQKK